MNREDPILDSDLDAFLDGTLDEAARERLISKMQSDAEAMNQVRLQERLDAAVRRLFAVPATPTFAHVDSVPISTQTTDSQPTRATHRTSLARAGRPARRHRTTRTAIAMGIAVSLVWFLVGWQLMHPSGPRTEFVRRPLTDIYRETLRAGFQPYYDCQDPQRFADVFRQRQGLALRLADPQIGARMLGLSYPGGLSRETTAMLCDVDQKAVMVFVDRAQQDDPIALQNESGDLHVFRRELESLVIYEVTPWPAARMIDSLQTID